MQRNVGLQILSVGSGLLLLAALYLVLYTRRWRR